ncbi:MAG: c-type cytochrome, partial [Desulfobacterales bacterium]|nr:c-type cytochrome [Desulfobacterales bacterium]
MQGGQVKRIYLFSSFCVQPVLVDALRLSTLRHAFVRLSPGWALLYKLLAALLFSTSPVSSIAASSTPELYKAHCAECHGPDRLGSIGPALLPGNLKRLRQNKAEAVIKLGRTATQMPAFGEKLTGNEIQQLAEYIFKPPEASPEWTAEDIRASRIIHSPEAIAGKYENARPIYEADPLNLFLVVESGTHHVSVLDGDRLEPIH